MVTNYDIEALIDNELDWKKRIEVHRHIKSNEKARDFYERIKKQKNLLQKVYGDQMYHNQR